MSEVQKGFFWLPKCKVASHSTSEVQNGVASRFRSSNASRSHFAGSYTSKTKKALTQNLYSRTTAQEPPTTKTRQDVSLMELFVITEGQHKSPLLVHDTFLSTSD
jgi:hypothetical protein